jgi:hypothetical protein
MGLCASASDITLPILENVRRKLRRLVKLIEPKDRKIVYTDFEDGIGAAIEMEAQPMILSNGIYSRYYTKLWSE